MTKASPSLHPLANLAAAPRWARVLVAAYAVAVAAAGPAWWALARTPGVVVAPSHSLAGLGGVRLP